jgi:hypothetical protein
MWRWEFTLIPLLARPVERKIDGDAVTVGNLHPRTHAGARSAASCSARVEVQPHVRAPSLHPCVSCTAPRHSTRSRDRAPIDIASGRSGRQHDLGVLDSTAAGVIEDPTEPAIVNFLSGTIGRPGWVENPEDSNTPLGRIHTRSNGVLSDSPPIMARQSEQLPILLSRQRSVEPVLQSSLLKPTFLHLR